MRGLLGRVSLFFYALFPRHARTKNRKWYADTHYDTHPNPKEKNEPLVWLQASLRFDRAAMH